MLRGLIAFCPSRRLLVLVSFAAFLCLGMAAATTLNIEAYPDPAPPIIEIIAQYPGSVARGGGALRHHPDRDRALEHGGAEVRAL
jgi:Cu/Ag efflux pump CusA